MLDHLDDPSPPTAPPPGLREAVAAGIRKARKRRRVPRRAGAIVAILVLLVGVASLVALNTGGTRGTGHQVRVGSEPQSVPSLAGIRLQDNEIRFGYLPAGFALAADQRLNDPELRSSSGMSYSFMRSILFLQLSTPPRAFSLLIEQAPEYLTPPTSAPTLNGSTLSMT